MSWKTQSKFVHEDNSQEDVKDYKDEYENYYYHCGYCYYRTTNRCFFDSHMREEHPAPLAESESLEEDLMMNAIEVWKIYKLLQRMKNVYK